MFYLDPTSKNIEYSTSGKGIGEPFSSALDLLVLVKKPATKRAKAAGKPKVKTAAAKEPKAARKAAGASTANGTGKHREGTKRQQLISMMQRKNGVSIEEAMESMGWLRHTLRGAVSTLGSKGGFVVTSTREGGRGMVYRIVA